jgi:D-alanine-D-alanine ligase
MHVVILHQDVAPDASADEQDVLVQRDAVAAALERLGHAVESQACTLNLEALSDRLTQRRPDLVFNLVESLNGTDALQSFVPALLETMNLPFTGSSAAAIVVSGRKTLAKQILRTHDLPTPAWFSAEDFSRHARDFAAGRYILKPLAEHASLGMVDADVVDVTTIADLERRLSEKTRQLGRPCFAEQYVDGREFNLSLLAGPDGPEMLPPAEIRFEGYAADKPKIVGRDAKWSEDSFEYRATVRTFASADSDAPLFGELRDLSIRCWQALDLAGYARVDFRIDPAGRPWILEANANPCLSPDAGFAAAAQQAGLTFDEVVARILNSVS